MNNRKVIIRILLIISLIIIVINRINLLPLISGSAYGSTASINYTNYILIIVINILLLIIVRRLENKKMCITVILFFILITLIPVYKVNKLDIKDDYLSTSQANVIQTKFVNIYGIKIFINK